MAKYYGLYGNNGLGIYDDWHKVVASRCYLRGNCVKPCCTFDEAEKFAIDGFLYLNGEDLPECMPGRLPMNFVVYRRAIVRDW